MGGTPVEAPVRFGLIGAGAIMRLSHAPTISRSADARLMAVFDQDAERATSLAEAFGAAPCNELDRLLERPDIDAVVVATPNRYHPEAVIAAAAAGKHVLCEKPLAIDIQAARRMVDACAAAGVVLQVGFNQRYWNQVRIAKTLIEQGVIGKVHGFRSIYAERWNVYPAATRYRYDLALSGGATIIDLTIHRIDLVRHLLGEFRSVMAEVAHSVVPDAIDDNVWLLARLESGAQAASPPTGTRPPSATGRTFTARKARSIWRPRPSTHSTPFRSPSIPSARRPTSPTCCARRTIPRPGGRASRAAGSP